MNVVATVWIFLQQNPFLIGAATGSLAVYLISSLVNYIKREKRWLGFSVDTRTIISKGHQRLTIRFGAQEISTLHSHSIVIRNIGNRAIKDLPILIRSDKGEIVEHELEKPEGADFPLSLNIKGQISIQCELLNPGETFTLGFTVADAESQDVRVIARSEGLTLKEISTSAPLEEMLDVLVEVSGSSLFTMSVNAVAKLLFTRRRK